MRLARKLRLAVTWTSMKAISYNWCAKLNKIITTKLCLSFTKLCLVMAQSRMNWAPSETQTYESTSLAC